MISVQSLYKTYPDGTQAIKGISFDIKKGETFGILGPNGAGKSTTINILTGSLKPTSGQITYNDKIYNHIPRNIASQIGIMGQDIILWDRLTGLENLTFFGTMQGLKKEFIRTRASYLLHELGLDNKQNSRAGGYSGGMKRRLHLAMALIQDPEILFMDEPTPGMDVQSRIVMMEFLEKLKKETNTTIVITSHYIEEVDRLSDRVAIINNGELIKLDTPNNLKKSIGEGDVLEINSKNMITTEIKQHIKKELKKNNIDIRIIEKKLLIKTLDAVNKLKNILEGLDKTKIDIESISLRGNTLEDVFIYLTGKKIS